MTTATAAASATCPKCDGKGRLPHYGHIASGVCFTCGGSGSFQIRQRTDGTVKTSLEVFMLGGQFSYAAHRATVLADDGTWGKCLICSDLDDADAARSLWSDLKGQENTRLSVTVIEPNEPERTKVYQQW